ncbi:MAG: pyridoxine 4-dehydrogenase [Thermoleophilaceae bacterium]|nr:pyridoxine 4-dehydrogenase [Thermoleophilaceae bacterium]
MPDAAASGTFAIGGELVVHRLGFGAMRITGDGVWGPPPDPESAKAVLRRAVELGVNLIDTADAYGPHISEELIAEALYPYPEGMVIATKGGLQRPSREEWVPDGRPEHLKRACEGSLRRLRLERIDLYQLHRPDPHVPYEESVGAMKELRDEGKIRHVGVSNVNRMQLAAARSVVEIATVQNRYSVTDRAWQATVDECAREGLGFFPWSPLAAGELGEGGPLREIADRHGATPFQVAIAWLLHASPVMLPIPGTSSLQHLEENVAAAELELTGDELGALDALAG